MTPESLVGQDWQDVVERLGGVEFVEASAKQTGAFERPRQIKTATDLLRLILAYCLGDGGLRSTAAWAASVNFADVSNVALLFRLRKSGAWLSDLVGRLLAADAADLSHGRLIRLVDATTVRKAGRSAKTGKGLWRIHAAFDVPHERFSHFELTDQTGGERLDRIDVVAGEIRIGDRAYLQPDRIANVLQAGADVIVRATWSGAKWRDGHDTPFDLIGELKRHSRLGLIDRPIRIARKGGDALDLRLVAIKKTPEAAEKAKLAARKQSRRGGHKIAPQTLIAAEWIILVTSLDPQHYSTQDILALYRLRWRIELAFKRLKSLIGLKQPPGKSEQSARPWVLAHLLMILLLEPLIDEFEDSPHWAAAA